MKFEWKSVWNSWWCYELIWSSLSSHQWTWFSFVTQSTKFHNIWSTFHLVSKLLSKLIHQWNYWVSHIALRISIVITILHIWNLLEVLHQRNLKLESSLESVELPQGVKDHFALILLENSSGSKWNHQEFLVKFWWRSLSMVDGDLD